MKQATLTIFTRTPLHVGAGSSVGAVDQPVIRERHTRFPVIPGSSIKGVLADLWREQEQATDKEGKPRVDKDGAPVMVRAGDGRFLFGSDDNKNAAAGALLIGEGRLLAFPVRSARGCFAWITCPLVLSRFQRDFAGSAFDIPGVSSDSAVVSADSELTIDDKIVLEEYALKTEKEEMGAIIESLLKLSEDEVWASVAKRLAVVSDELFAYFVEQACEVAQHIRIDDETGTVSKRALFSQENVPSETLFYSLIAAHAGRGCALGRTADEALQLLADKLASDDVCGMLQIGADETTGLGWCTTTLIQ